MFTQIKETFAPSHFTKGLLKYKEGEFEEARKFTVRAVKNMPDLGKDTFYKAVFLLIESEFGKNFDAADYEEALLALENSPYKDSSDFFFIANELKNKSGTLDCRE